METERQTAFQHEVFAAFAERTIKRLTVIIIVLLSLWAGTVGLFVWYLNQYEFVDYDYTQDGAGVNIMGNQNGVEYYGSATENPKTD